MLLLGDKVILKMTETPELLQRDFQADFRKMVLIALNCSISFQPQHSCLSCSPLQSGSVVKSLGALHIGAGCLLLSLLKRSLEGELCIHVVEISDLINSVCLNLN